MIPVTADVQFCNGRAKIDLPPGAESILSARLSIYLSYTNLSTRKMPRPPFLFAESGHFCAL